MNPERYERGLQMLAAVDGVAGQNVVETLAQSFPDFARYVVEFPFGDIYARNGLGLRERNWQLSQRFAHSAVHYRSFACMYRLHCTSAANRERWWRL